MTKLEKIINALADAKGRFVGFDMDRKSLDSRMRAKCKETGEKNNHWKQGWEYVSTLNVKTGVQYKSDSPEIAPTREDWATMEIMEGTPVYTHKQTGEKYIGVMPNGGSKKVFNGLGEEASELDLLYLDKFMVKRKPTWMRLSIDRIRALRVNGAAYGFAN